MDKVTRGEVSTVEGPRGGLKRGEGSFEEMEFEG